MIKRLYLVNGELVKALDNRDADIEVDATTAQQLVNGLSLGDWCYLTLEYQDNLEIIKITKTPIELQVDRAQDNTTAKNFPVGAKIRYRLTRREILDVGSLQTLNLYSDGLSGLSVANNNGYQINYKLNNPNTLGGIETTFEQDGGIVIRDKIGAFGCCDSNLTGAPSVGGQIFYLTSQLYAVYGQDQGASSTPRTKGSEFNPIGDMLLLDKNTSLLESKYIAGMASMLDLDVFGGSESYSGVDRYVKSSAYPLDMGIFGGSKEFLFSDGGNFSTSNGTNFIETNTYPLEMLLYGNSVIYSGSDFYVNPTVKILDMSII